MKYLCCSRTYRFTTNSQLFFFDKHEMVPIDIVFLDGVITSTSKNKASNHELVKSAIETFLKSCRFESKR